MVGNLFKVNSAPCICSHFERDFWELWIFTLQLTVFFFFFFEDIKVIVLSSVNVPATANRSIETNLIHWNYSLNKFNILVHRAANKLTALIPYMWSGPELYKDRLRSTYYVVKVAMDEGELKRKHFKLFLK